MIVENYFLLSSVVIGFLSSLFPSIYMIYTYYKKYRRLMLTSGHLSDLKFFQRWSEDPHFNFLSIEYFTDLIAVSLLLGTIGFLWPLTISLFLLHKVAFGYLPKIARWIDFKIKRMVLHKHQATILTSNSEEIRSEAQKILKK